MPWTFIVHDCEIPSKEEIDSYQVSSVWTCPVCGSTWIKGEREFYRNTYNNEEGNARPTNPPDAADIATRTWVAKKGDPEFLYGRTRRAAMNYQLPDLSVRPTFEDDDYEESPIVGTAMEDIPMGEMGKVMLRDSGPEEEVEEGK